MQWKLILALTRVSRAFRRPAVKLNPDKFPRIPKGDAMVQQALGAFSFSRATVAKTIAFALLTLLTTAQAEGPPRAVPITNAPMTTEAPEVVRLAIQRTSDTGSCTGIVLTGRIILTAAHCVQGATGIKVFFYAALGTSGTRVFPSTEIFGRATFYPHPDFDGSPLIGTNDNDIAVVRLADPGMSKYDSARIFFDDRRPWMANSGATSREDRRVYAFGIGTGSPQGSSSDCDAAGNTSGTKRRADRIYVQYVQAAPNWTRGEQPKILASMDGQHLCPGDSGGAWTLRRMDGQQDRFLTFAIHYTHTEDWWYDTAYGTSIRAYWEWVIGRANHAHVGLACPTAVLSGSGYRYKTCSENAMGDQCVAGQTRLQKCSGNYVGPGVNQTCEAGFWENSGGRCEPKAPPGGQRP
jgi:hypothetical protein